MNKLGYVICNDQGEFLTQFVSTTDYYREEWSDKPSEEFLFTTRQQANKAAKAIKGPGNGKLYTLLLMATETEYFVKPVLGPVPPWLQGVKA